MIKCSKCGSDDMRIMGKATLAAPMKYLHNFTKTNLRDKDVYLYGVDWETFDFICMNPKCGFTYNAYGNYVTRLQKENDELKNKIQELEKRVGIGDRK